MNQSIAVLARTTETSTPASLTGKQAQLNRVARGNPAHSSSELKIPVDVNAISLYRDIDRVAWDGYGKLLGLIRKLWGKYSRSLTTWTTTTRWTLLTGILGQR